MASNIAIDTNRIEAMVAQLRSVGSKTQHGVGDIGSLAAQIKGASAHIDALASKVTIQGVTQQQAVAPIAAAEIVADKPAQRVDFSTVLKSALDQVNEAQGKARKLSQSFAMGDDNINLSDVMIAMQKSSISFQTSVQVRNKLVSAYRDIMTMQV